MTCNLNIIKNFRVSRTLFFKDDGSPTVFYIDDVPGPTDALREIIDRGGGIITNDKMDDCIKLCEGAKDPAIKDGYLPLSYIKHCVMKNELLSMKQYRSRFLIEIAPSSNDIDDDSDHEPVTKQSRIYCPRIVGRRKYSTAEDLRILKFIIDHKAYKKVKGNKIWQQMEELKITEHTHQSMKHRYLKSILPTIHQYNIPPEWVDRLTQNDRRPWESDEEEQEKEMEETTNAEESEDDLINSERDPSRKWTSRRAKSTQAAELVPSGSGVSRRKKTKPETTASDDSSNDDGNSNEKNNYVPANGEAVPRVEMSDSDEESEEYAYGGCLGELTRASGLSKEEDGSTSSNDGDSEVADDRQRYSQDKRSPVKRCIFLKSKNTHPQDRSGVSTRERVREKERVRELSESASDSSENILSTVTPSWLGKSDSERGNFRINNSTGSRQGSRRNISDKKENETDDSKKVRRRKNKDGISPAGKGKLLKSHTESLADPSELEPSGSGVPRQRRQRAGKSRSATEKTGETILDSTSDCSESAASASALGQGDSCRKYLNKLSQAVTARSGKEHGRISTDEHGTDSDSDEGDSVTKATTLWRIELIANRFGLDHSEAAYLMLRHPHKFWSLT